MTKKYIKRQLVLSELGIPMDEDIKEYYFQFCSRCGNLDIRSEDFGNTNIDIIINNNHSAIGYVYSPTNEITPFHDSSIYILFEHELGLKMNDCDILITSFIEYKLNL